MDRTQASIRLLSWWHAFVAAFQLLSRFPFPWSVPFEREVLVRSTIWYPVVGLAIGSALAGTGLVGGALLPPGAAAAVLTALWVMLTGGLHLDGLMDTADGLLSHRSRERMLEIMKDSRVGAMGVIACVLQLIMKYTLLEALLDSAWPLAAGLLVAVPVWSRAFMVAAIAYWPYARSEGGMGGMLEGVGIRQTAGAWAIAGLLSTVLLTLAAGGLPQAILWSAGGAALAVLVGGLVGMRIASRLGGLTGDAYGAINELTETGLLAAAVAALTYLTPL